MDKNENNLAADSIDVRKKVADKIAGEKIKMRHPFFFMAKKLGMRSVLVLVIVFGALAFDVVFYLLKKTGSLRFLGFGTPGLQVFLKSFPFDYLALFVITLLVANYLLKELDLSRGLFLFANVPIIFLLSLAIVISIFFGKMGAGEIIKERMGCALPKEAAAHGEVIAVSKKDVIIRTMDGRTEEIVLGDDVKFPYNFDYAKGKFLRAVGFLDEKNPSIFHAEQVQCCDAE